MWGFRALVRSCRTVQYTSNNLLERFRKRSLQFFVNIHDFYIEIYNMYNSFSRGEEERFLREISPPHFFFSLFYIEMSLKKVSIQKFYIEITNLIELESF